ncbi:proteasome subunit beta [Pseudomonas fluorescens]|uniref:proteasome subunit beta n=1 Tax=Pseudomonas fluorescens TaxID=294 RepID=UPI003D23CEFB
MTTIAYKDGVIAYDGRITRGTQIAYDDFDKCLERDGVRFICSGANADFENLMDAYFGAQVPSCDASAIIVADGVVWCGAVDDSTGFWKVAVVQNKPYAIGSGSVHALTAMDMGATAYQAVEMAMKRDSCTGGKIRTLTVKAES